MKGTAGLTTQIKGRPICRPCIFNKLSSIVYKPGVLI